MFSHGWYQILLILDLNYGRSSRSPWKKRSHKTYVSLCLFLKDLHKSTNPHVYIQLPKTFLPAWCPVKLRFPFSLPGCRCSGKRFTGADLEALVKLYAGGVRVALADLKVMAFTWRWMELATPIASRLEAIPSSLEFGPRSPHEAGALSVLFVLYVLFVHRVSKRGTAVQHVVKRVAPVTADPMETRGPVDPEASETRLDSRVQPMELA